MRRIRRSARLTSVSSLRSRPCINRCYVSRGSCLGSPGSPRVWLDATATLRERDAGERGQPVHQLVLESRVTGLCCGRLSLPVVPVAAAHGCGGVTADGEPCLGEIAHLQIAGCRGADAREGERERGYVQLALGVRLGGVPGPAGPVDIPEGPRSCVMQSAAEVDEPIRAADQRSEHVGREGVHRESLRVTVGGCGAGRLEEDAGIADNSVHPADLVHLTGEVPGLGCAAEVADDDSRGVRGEVAEHRRPIASAGVEDNVMAFTGEGTGGGAAESVGGAGDEDTGHGIILPPVVCWHRSAARGTWHPDPDYRSRAGEIDCAEPAWIQTQAWTCEPTPRSRRTDSRMTNVVLAV